MGQPDYRLIHVLEYELGFRDDPPPPRRTDEPGSVIHYDGTPQTCENMHAVLKDMWGAYPPGGEALSTP